MSHVVEDFDIKTCVNTNNFIVTSNAKSFIDLFCGTEYQSYSDFVTNMMNTKYDRGKIKAVQKLLKVCSGKEDRGFISVIDEYNILVVPTRIYGKHIDVGLFKSQLINLLNSL